MKINEIFCNQKQKSQISGNRFQTGNRYRELDASQPNFHHESHQYACALSKYSCLKPNSILFSYVFLSITLVSRRS